MLKKRTIKIITHLVNADNGIPLEILANEFQISVRTLRNEITEANYFLSKHSFGYIKNIKKTGVVITLDERKRQSFLKHISDVNPSRFLKPEERYFDLILDIALNPSPTYLYLKQEQYQVSKSTLDEDIKKVRQQLSYYQIEVISIVKKGLVFKGSERSIRMMLFDLINNHIGILDYNANIIDKSVYEKILFTYISKETYQKIDLAYDNAISAKQDSYYRKYFLIFTSIWINRIHNKNEIASFNEENAFVSESDITDFIKKINGLFRIPSSTREIKYLIFILKTLNPQNINNSLKWGQAQLLTIQLIQFIENDTNILFSQQEELYEGLYCHITGLLSRIENDLQVTNPLKDSIKKNHFALYNSVSKFIPLIEKMVKKDITEDEVAFLTIYFSASESKINQKIYYMYKAVVICNHGSATAKLLAENLKELFNIEIVAVLSSRELELIAHLDADIIFSTIKLNSISKPNLLLQPIIRDIDKEKIKDFLEQNSHLRRIIHKKSNHTQLFLSILNLIGENEIHISKKLYQELVLLLEQYDLKINKEEIQPMLKEILKETDILFNVPAQNWEDAISKVSAPLIESKVIEPRYINSMIEAVKKHGPYIVIDKHIALAHARPEDGVNQLGISVAKLKDPICFGHEDNDPVKVIFCLAATDSYSHLNIMKDLVELMNDPKRLEHLFNANNEQELKDLLYT